MDFKLLTLYGGSMPEHKYYRDLLTLLIDGKPFMDKLREVLDSTHDYGNVAIRAADVDNGQDVYNKQFKLLCNLSRSFKCRETAIAYNHNKGDVMYTATKFLIVRNFNFKGNPDTLIDFAQKVLYNYYDISAPTPKLFRLLYDIKHPDIGLYIKSLPLETKVRNNSCNLNGLVHLIDKDLMIIPLTSSFDATPVSYFLKIVRDIPELINTSSLNDLIRGSYSSAILLGKFAFMYFRHPLLLQLITYGTYSLFNGPESVMNTAPSYRCLNRLFYNLYKLLYTSSAHASIVREFLESWDICVQKDAESTGLISSSELQLIKRAKDILYTLISAVTSDGQSIIAHLLTNKERF